MKRILVVAALLATSLIHAPARAQEHVIKIATLAPEGSAWMNLLHGWAHEVEEKSNAQLKIKFYSGGVAGDERDAVRKMRLGQINGAGVTAIGLGLIQSEVRVFELPRLIRSDEELDYVRTKLDADIRKKFEEKGYVLLFWGDVGPVHIFSNRPITKRSDLAQTKLWAWIDDPMVRKLFEQLGANGVPLGVPDVLPSLQTGLIDTCYSSPLAVLALQWYAKVKYMTTMEITHSIGATVLAKRDFDKLSPDQQKALMTASATLEPKMMHTVREENARALQVMKQNGLQVIETPREMIADFDAQAQAIRPKLEPIVYSHEFRAKVEKLLAEFRAKK
jgi:TRAP-type C4-dicarboxylate transport system substrate-binding protein